ncbi:hypothetical protein [Methylomonas fluvii]|uniref:Uncharacterized protein n=1 Tax=Methylomonas fluvii TaxID=1854564 RepID=A0ABR9DKT1_9GAMM|nr:hypothetical protein [Methylomonas fluvii]MBD9363717.1 hypothetical protein [Methylomonas fluvii]CAD6877021.1 hypothetical protein [Methylomonas fluvii]
MQTAVREVKELLNRLPEESGYEDIQYHLYVMAKIRQGITRAEIEGIVPHEEVEKQFDCVFV